VRSRKATWLKHRSQVQDSLKDNARQARVAKREYDKRWNSCFITDPHFGRVIPQKKVTACLGLIRKPGQKLIRLAEERVALEDHYNRVTSLGAKGTPIPN